MSDEMTTHERLAAWLDGEAALYRERAQRAEDAQDWDLAVRYAGAADALVQLRDRVLLGEQIGPSPARQGRCRPGQNGGLAAIFGQWPGDETEAREYRRPAALLRTPRGEGEPVAYMVTASRYSGGGVEWVRDWLFRGPAECEEHVRWLHRPQSRWQDVRVTPLYAARRGEGGGE